jgi:hypothetical protein
MADVTQGRTIRRREQGGMRDACPRQPGASQPPPEFDYRAERQLQMQMPPRVDSIVDNID